MTPAQTEEKLQLIFKEISVSESPLLFSTPVSGDDYLDHFVTYNSEWTIEDGWLTGRNTLECAGLAVLKQNFPGNILLEFEGRILPPSTHDINFIWNGEWLDNLNSCGNAYVGSICGWYTQKIGIEKSPDYKLIATVPFRNFEPGKTYKVQAGSIDGNCFIFVDGELAIEMNDPHPIDNTKYTKVAFSVWCTQIQIRNIVIREIKWNPIRREYKPEFIEEVV